MLLGGFCMLYPNNIKKAAHKPISYANRGMALESLLNETNEYYKEKDIALIFKKPTPIGISEAVYTSHGRIIKNGYFKAQSTLDYNGIYKGHYVEFEAKETQNKTSFPLANFHEHQLGYIRRVIQHGGICFIILKMNQLIYFFKGEDLVRFLDENSRKSIPYSYIEEHGILIKEAYQPSIDYLSVIDKEYLKGEM